MRNLLIGIATLLVGMTILHAGSEGTWIGILSAYPATAVAPAPQKPKKVTVPAGTRILVRTIDPVDSSRNQAGYRFTASLETNLQVEDVVVAPRGTTVYGQLAQASSAGTFKGSSQLTLELTDIVINGNPYPLLTSTFSIKGQGEGSKTARKVIGGAGLGALIGGIAGGGAGAAIGAVAGAGAGTIIAGSKKGEQLVIPSESLIEFRLQQPAPLPVAK